MWQLEEFAAPWDQTHPATSQDLVAQLGASDSGLCLPAGDPEGDLHDQRDRIAAHDTAKGDEERASLPHEEAAMKLLYMALTNVSRKWHTIQSWREALNQFQILWPERMPALERA